MKSKFVIIGGGVAGLCAAIRLSELGEKPLLIEGGSYPTHKICGEFLSPECIHYLENWSIHPVSISQVSLRTQKQRLIFPFPSPSGGLSHARLDPSLAKYAQASGVKIKTDTLVTAFEPKMHPNEAHRIHLSENETIEALNVIIAVGKFPNYTKMNPVMRYMGFKTHFENLPLDNETLEMFSLPGVYLGISPIENGKFNVACLAEIKRIKSEDPIQCFERILLQNSFLSNLLSKGKKLFDQWMVGSLPEFGLKQTPNWQDAYFIGDAAITVPPACGNGLSMAIIGGRLVAEYAVRRQSADFKKMWIKRCSSQLRWAKILHTLMLNPSFGDPLIYITRHLPYIAKKMFELTRQTQSVI